MISNNGRFEACLLGGQLPRTVTLIWTVMRDVTRRVFLLPRGIERRTA